MSEQGEQTSHLDIDGCFNVRDAGGWPTDDGRRMASNALPRRRPVRLSEEGRTRIAGLGLRAVIDLRQQAQFDRGYAFGPAAITHHIPTVDRIIDVDNPPRFEQATDIVGFYEDMVERGPQLVRAVDTVAEHIVEGPVLVHLRRRQGSDGPRGGVDPGRDRRDPRIDRRGNARSRTSRRRRRRTAMISAPLSGDPPVGRSPALLWTAPAEAMALFAERIVEVHGSMAGWRPASASLPRPSTGCGIGSSPTADRIQARFKRDPASAAVEPVMNAAMSVQQNSTARHHVVGYAHPPQWVGGGAGPRCRRRRPSAASSVRALQAWR